MLSARRLRRIAIIGGGLGGLLAAQALRDCAALEVTVYERDTEHGSRPQGYQIGLNETGLQALKAGGVSLRSLCDGRSMDGVKVLSHDLKVMLEFEMPKPKPKPNNPKVASSHKSSPLPSSESATTTTPTTTTEEDEEEVSMSWLLDRWKLRELLTKDLNIVWNKQFVRYEEQPDCVRVHFADGTSIEADFVIGADGSKSLVRQQRCPELVREAVGIAGVAGYLPMSQAPKLEALARNSLVRVLGPQGISLLLLTFSEPSSPERNLLWAITHPKEVAPYPEDLAGQHAMAIDLAHRMNPEIESAVRQTLLDNFLPPYEYFSLQLPAKSSQKKQGLGKTCRVTLLGDAAHPMTTHAGLGANMAFADAIDIANALKQQASVTPSSGVEATGDGKDKAKANDPSSGDWVPLVAAYEHKLMKRGYDAVQTSLKSTRTIHQTGRFAVLARNGLVRTMGSVLAGYRAIKRHPFLSFAFAVSAVGGLVYWLSGRSRPSQSSANL